MSITFDAATAAAVIRNQGKLIEILSDDAKQLKSSTAFCANLQNRVTELTGENASLRAKLADAEATIKLLKTVSPPVPYALETKQEKKEAARRDATASTGDVCPACGIALVAKDGKLAHPFNLCHWDKIVLYPAMWRIIRLGVETDRAISTSPEGTSFSWKDACEAAWKQLKELKEKK